MTPAQRAILSKAKKDGLKPSEIAAEFGVHDLVEAQLSILRGISVAYKDLGEKGQDSAIQQLTTATRDAVTDMIRLIMANGTTAIPFKLKSLTIDGKLKVVGTVEGDHPERHALTDKAHDKSEILLILSPRDYFEGLDTIQGERDQKSLPLNEDAPAKPKAERTSAATGSATSAKELAKKATELPPKLLEDARAFILNQQVSTVSGIQNGLKIGAVKAVAVLDQLVVEGIVEFVGDEKAGEYKIVRTPADATQAIKEDPETQPASGKGSKTKASAKPAATEKPASTSRKPLSFDGDDDAPANESPISENQPKTDTGGLTLTDAVYKKAKAQVIKSKRVSAGALAISLDIDDDVAEQAIQRMEAEGIVTEENEAGVRSLVEAA